MAKKRPVGRPAFEITPEVTAKAEALASTGLTLEQIAHSLGISYETLNERRKEFPEFSEAIIEGKSKGIAVITNSLFKKAKGGDISAIKYYLNNRDKDNWKEKVETTNVGEEGNRSTTKSFSDMYGKPES